MRMLTAVLSVSLILAGCNSDDDSTSSAATSSAWKLLATLPATGYTMQGFTSSSRGEIILAGGMDATTGAMTSKVFIFPSNGAGGYGNPSIVNLPAAQGLVRPELFAGGDLLVFGGSVVTSRGLWAQTEVFRYRPATKDFVKESADPRPAKQNYAGSANGLLFSVNGIGSGIGLPPTVPRNNPSINVYTDPASATVTDVTDTPVIAIYVQDHQGQVYLFGGFLGPTSNTDVWSINVQAKTVDHRPARIDDRPQGIGLMVAGQVHLIGGTGPSANTVQTYDPVSGATAIRTDLVPPVAVTSDNARVFSTLVLVQAADGSYTLYQYQP